MQIIIFLPVFIWLFVQIPTGVATSSIFILIIAICTSLYNLVSLTNRIGDTSIDDEYNFLPHARKRVGICGAICCIFALINLFYCHSDHWWALNIEQMFIYFFATTISFFVMLFWACVSPTKKSSAQTRQLNLLVDEMNRNLSAYDIDKGFQITTSGFKLGICTQQKQLLIYKVATSLDMNQFFNAIPFETIIACELLEDNSTVLKSGVGRAVVGAAIAGEVGAIIGASSRESSDMVNSLIVRIFP